MTVLKRLLLITIYSLTYVAQSQNVDSIQKKINNYLSQAKLDSAKTYIKTNISDTTSKEYKNILNYQLVKVLFMQSLYKEALEQAFSSIDSVEDETQIVKFNFMIGAIYSAIADYNKSIEYFDKVIQQSKEPSLTVQTHLLLSNLHLGRQDSTEASEAISAAYKIIAEADLDVRTENHVAMQYNFFKENYEQCKALNFITINDSTSFLNAKSYAYSMVGECLIKQDSLHKATEYLNEFLKLTFKTKDPEQIKVAANKLIEVHEKLGNQEQANTYHKIYNEAVSDSLSFSIVKYRDLYNIEKNRELALAKSEHFKRNLWYSAIILLLLSAGVYYISKNKKLLNAIKNTPGKKVNVSEKETKKIEKAIETLISEQQYLTPNITRKSFCDQARIKSERYLSQHVNDNYKKSFSVFINDLRIKYAYNRIQNDQKFRNYKIDVIAATSGFGSRKSFERAFLAKYNTTPFKFILSQIA